MIQTMFLLCFALFSKHILEIVRIRGEFSLTGNKNIYGS